MGKTTPDLQQLLPVTVDNTNLDIFRLRHDHKLERDRKAVADRLSGARL